MNGLEVSGGWCIFEQLELLGGDVPIACVRASPPISHRIERGQTSPSRDAGNRARLAAAFRDLNARIYTESAPSGLAFDFTGETLNRAEIWNLATSAGRLDIVFLPSGTEGYDALARGAVRLEVFGVELLAAGLEDIIRSKEAADRPQDRQDVAVLREMLRLRKGSGSS